MVSHRVAEGEAREFLAERFGRVEELSPLTGGFWSSAYSFTHAGRELVVRFGANKEWFEADRAAMAFASPGLPVPEVYEIGDAFGGAYVVSARHYGTRLEDVRPDQREVAGPMLASLLGALYAVPKNEELPVGWHGQPLRADLTWRDWLCERLVEDPTPGARDWRAALAAESEAERVFTTCAARIRELVASCPERRDLVHGDLLHANVLVTEDASRPRAVFSWKCSVRGDFLYDVAWCTFWSAWHPGIAAADPWSRTQREPCFGDEADAWVEAPLRHYCYELHIGATHLGWNACIGDLGELRRVLRHLTVVLRRGPLRLARSAKNW